VSAHRSLRPERVQPTRLADLAVAAPGLRLRGTGDVWITGITHDSRAVRPGDLYAALPGSSTHGAQFTAQAAAAGAIAVLTDGAGSDVAGSTASDLPMLVAERPRDVLGPVSSRVYADPSSSLRVLGITGTSGKTTAAYLLDSGLAATGAVTGLIGTVETRVAGERMPSERTTPEATDLQALLAVMRERSATAVAMEVSSHALALGRVEGTHFAAVGFTNFGSDHLDFHRDRGDYFAAKARLFDGRSPVEVLNVDDPAVRSLRTARSVTVTSRGESATWSADSIRRAGTGQTFIARGPGGITVSCRVNLLGAFNVDNAVLSLAMLASMGLDPQQAADGIAACPGVPGRLERVGATGPVLGVVDYAHKPEAVAAVLEVLREATAGRLIAVLGCGGDRDRGKRPVMGQVAARSCDLLVVTDDNPRSEDPAAIRAAMLAGCAEVPAGLRAVVTEIADRAEAIEHAVRSAGAGDTVAVLGKGHESYQEVAGNVIAFDDRVVLAEALRGVRA
jgi:UDP-N-acetylmuramoyl-L-alanyl-D-glutamate--2,6-diaminopimelate ligase